MGAHFNTVDWSNPKASQDTLETDFQQAVENAGHDYGHAGYTGTLAEATGIVFIDTVDDWLMAETLAHDVDDACIDHHCPQERRNPRYPQYSSDKWEPAGAILVKDKGWLFFGWFSS